MRVRQYVPGPLGLAAVCLCLLTASAAASEVLDLLSDLEGDFRAAHQQLVGLQSRLDKLQLDGALDRAGESPIKLVSELDSIGTSAGRVLSDLRGRVAKIREMQPALQEKFPEDRTRVDQYFTGFGELQARSEVLVLSIRQDLESARTRLASNLDKLRNVGARESLLAAVRDRLQRREAALALATANQEASAAPQEPGPTAASEQTVRVAAPELGHPPVTAKAPRRATRHRPRRPAAAPASAPAPATETGSPSVTVDLEQLIQEMER